MYKERERKKETEREREREREKERERGFRGADEKARASSKGALRKWTSSSSLKSISLEQSSFLFELSICHPPMLKMKQGPFLDASWHLYNRVCPSVIPSVRPSFRPSVRPSIRPSVRPSIHPSVRPSVCPSVRPSIIFFSRVHATL